MEEPQTGDGVSRREFVTVVISASAAGALMRADSSATLEAAAPHHASSADVAFTVNNRPVRLSVDPRMSLLDALRERLHLTGSKKGCDHGQCGACTVHVEGRRVLSCLTLAATLNGKHVTTIEGLAEPDGSHLHPVQSAFIKHDGFQCGYCTPGQIMSAVALLGEPCGGSDNDVREWMSGNICRCGAYPGIVAAIQSVRRERS